MSYHAYAMTHPYLDELSIDHIKLTLTGIRMTHHVYHAYAMTHKYRIAKRIASKSHESYNVYRLVKWIIQLLTAPFATWKPYTEKRLLLVTANEKQWLQFWDPYMFCKIANHWPGGIIKTRVRGISSHFHDGVPMQRLFQDLLQKLWFEKTQRIRSWRRILFVWQMLQNVQQKGCLRKKRTYFKWIIHPCTVIRTKNMCAPDVQRSIVKNGIWRNTSKNVLTR